MLIRSKYLLTKSFSEAAPKVLYKLNDDVQKSIDKVDFKPRHHPGIFKQKPTSLPENFYKATMSILEDYPIKTVLSDSKPFIRHLKNKVPPMEDHELKETISKLRAKVVNKLTRKNSTHIDNMDIINNQVKNQLKTKVYNWKTLKYNEYESLLYLVGRAAAEYAVLTRIFLEIKQRDKEFAPKTLFDFGSGVGTVTWAANLFWKQHFFEYFNVDTSSTMNEINECLLKGGKNKQSNLKGVFFRQFLPATPVPYDLVVSAYTLMELPSLQNRLQTVLNLWNKTQKYLIIIEQGTNGGFRIINEVRDYILNFGNGHVFSPCSHDKDCPRHLSTDGTPCNFEVRYYNMPIGENLQIHTERFSYVVFKKGPKDKDETEWPRLVRKTLLRHKHCVCNLCTKDGKLEQVIITKSKQGTAAYRCAKASTWGDLLPLDVNNDKD